MADQQPTQAVSSPSGPSLAGPFALICFAVVFFLFAVVAMVMASWAWYQMEVENTTRVTLTTVGLTAAVIASVAGIAMTIIGSVRWALRSSVPSGGSAGQDQTQTQQLLTSINERLLLSDTAKRIAYRHEDIQMLRKTIRDDIARNHCDAALALVTELSQTFGYLEEAESFRDQIAAARTAETEAKITQAIAHLEESIKRHEFDRAAREADKIERLFPDSQRAGKLPRRVGQARDEYKHEMEREFLTASEREDVDRAMELLKEMDKYLTESEAAPFREVARGVIGKKKDNFGVQFKIAVHDREWLRAVRVGEQIIHDFPNSKMSGEVRGMLDLLRERAAGQQAAQPQQATTT